VGCPPALGAAAGYPAPHAEVTDVTQMRRHLERRLAWRKKEHERAWGYLKHYPGVPIFVQEERLAFVRLDECRKILRRYLDFGGK
jgi:hypothetical protein